jgi:hypothetical protein
MNYTNPNPPHNELVKKINPLFLLSPFHVSKG